MSNRPFFDIARDLRRGQFIEDCTDRLKEVVDAVNDTGKAAELVVRIKVKPASKVAGAVVVSDEVTAKLPKLPPGDTLMWGTPEGSLMSSDPNQKTLDLKVAGDKNAPTANLKTA